MPLPGEDIFSFKKYDAPLGLILMLAMQPPFLT
jgi:hypothetical protein